MYVDAIMTQVWHQCYKASPPDRAWASLGAMTQSIAMQCKAFLVKNKGPRLERGHVSI